MKMQVLGSLTTSSVGWMRLTSLTLDSLDVFVVFQEAELQNCSKQRGASAESQGMAGAECSFLGPLAHTETVLGFLIYASWRVKQHQLHDLVQIYRYHINGQFMRL